MPGQPDAAAETLQFQYAVVRVVPRVERGESIKVFPDPPSVDDSFLIALQDNHAHHVLAIICGCVDAGGAGVNPDNPPVRWEAWQGDIDRWVAENDARGRRLQGDVLAPTTAATTVRVRGGELLVSDGPFAETKEVIVGYDILECADLDEAIEVARTHPMARGGRMELRPFADLDR